MTEAVSWEEAEWPPTRCNVQGGASCDGEKGGVGK